MKKTYSTLLKIGIVTIMCMIIVITLLIILFLNKEPNPEDEQAATLKDNNAILKEETVSKLDGVSEYFNLKNCIQIYYSAIANLEYSTSANEVGLGYKTERSR